MTTIKLKKVQQSTLRHKVVHSKGCWCKLYTSRLRGDRRQWPAPKQCHLNLSTRERLLKFKMVLFATWDITDVQTFRCVDGYSRRTIGRNVAQPVCPIRNLQPQKHTCTLHHPHGVRHGFKIGAPEPLLNLKVSRSVILI